LGREFCLSKRADIRRGDLHEITEAGLDTTADAELGDQDKPTLDLLDASLELVVWAKRDDTVDKIVLFEP
jgi:hypothetical protein